MRGRRPFPEAYRRPSRKKGKGHVARGATRPFQTGRMPGLLRADPADALFRIHSTPSCAPRRPSFAWWQFPVGKMLTAAPELSPDADDAFLFILHLGTPMFGLMCTLRQRSDP